MNIREERIEDYSEVYALIKEAFATAEHSDGNEQNLVVALRSNKEAFLPALSLVAEHEGEIVGHILFTKAKVAGDEVLVLAPLSVKPSCQRQGIGQALIQEGHRVAQEKGFRYSVVLGSADYYPKMGYVPAEQFGIQTPGGIPPENFMAIALQSNAPRLNGPIAYAKEFGL